MNKSDKPIVIAFSGGCFSGKTTTMEELEETLKAKGIKVVTLNELIRERYIGSIDKIREDPSMYLAFQNEVIRAKIDAEIKCLNADAQVVLVDRAITDSLFYLLFYVDKSKLTFRDTISFMLLQSHIMSHIEYAWFNIYDLVVEFKPLDKLCDDTVYRPKHIDALKHIEHTTISMLNDYANRGLENKCVVVDLNHESADAFIADIIERFNL